MYLLPSLPYDHDALAPVISARTLQIHHGRHHARYVQVVNELTAGARMILEELMARSLKSGDTKLFNNAAQAWNHAFFWESMSPVPTKLDGALAQAIDGTFGGIDGLRKEFLSRGVGQFGSGWVWLVVDGGSLEIVATHDAEVPWLGSDCVPLLVCDVWEHAYYLDYQNERDRFLGAWFDQLANWDFARRQLATGTGRYRFPGVEQP